MIDDSPTAAGGSHEGSCEGRQGEASGPHVTAAVRFRIAGALRFLSHAETFRVWQRACARAGWAVRYSEGFNPHPKMSLPLPRPVGVESDEESLVVQLHDDLGDASPERRAEWAAALARALGGQLPEGITVGAVEFAAGKASVQPQSAEYVLPVRDRVGTGLAEPLRGRVAALMESEHCLVERASAPGRATRSVDVRPFVQAIRWESGDLIVQHRTGAGGSIRVEEILHLFGLQMQDLAGPIRRRNVVWKKTEIQNGVKAPWMETRAEDLEDGT